MLLAERMQNNPLNYLDIIDRIENGHPNSDIDKLLPWAYRKQGLKAESEDDAYANRGQGPR